MNRYLKEVKVCYHTRRVLVDSGLTGLNMLFNLVFSSLVLQHGNTALHEAAWRGYSRCVKLLCTFSKIDKSNQKPNKSRNGKTNGDLCQINNYLNTRNAGGFSALHLASQNGHNQSCREILLAGADANIQNNVKSDFH